MSNEEKTNNTPKHGPGRVMEKPKDFKKVITRLFKDMGRFRFKIIISVILATVAAVFSIYGPNKISDLTEKIQEGLIIDRDKFEEVSLTLSEDLDMDNLRTLATELLNVDISSNTISKLMADTSISQDDKVAFTKTISEINETNILNKLLELPASTLKYVLPDSVILGVDVSTEDKVKYINLSKTLNVEEASQESLVHITASLPESIKEIIFKESTIDGVRISSQDKIDFLNALGPLTKDSKNTDIYEALDKMPENIKDLIKPKMDLDGIKSIIYLLGTIYLISAIFNYIQAFIMEGVSNRFAREFRKSLALKINRLPLKYFDNHTVGDTLSRMTNDIDTIEMALDSSLSTLMNQITLVVGSIIMMFVTNWIMAISAILSSIIGFVFMGLIMSRSQKYFQMRQKELGKLNGHIEEVYRSLNVVKAYNGESDASEKFDRYNNNVYKANFKSQFLGGLMPPIMGFIGNFSYVVVCVVGAVLVLHKTINFGDVVAFIIYVRLFTNPLSQLAQSFTQLQTAGAAGERVYEFMDEEEMPEEEVKHELKKIKGEVEFDHVKFGYTEDKVIIKDFSCKIKSGEKIAIVGPTGAGKTTLVNLLMKFYNINSGSIKIDGIDTNELSRDNIHDSFIMVLQDTWLFNGTIRDNIKYNQKNVSDEEIWNALRVVGVDHFVKSLPGGLDYEITDNDSISAGEKQLLTIARGMIKDSPLLILDEATSSVDTRTEELVQKSMDKLMEGRTSFIIAHRLSTIKNADLILVMNDGNIIEQGTHDELIKQNGFYADLYNSQFEKI